MKFLNHWRRRRLLRQPKDTRPCAICGLASDIRINKGNLGKLCLYYGVRIAVEELNDPTTGLRPYCVSDGNQFTWPVRGFTTQDLLSRRIKHSDWYLNRLSIKIASIVGVMSLLFTAIGIWIR